MNSTFNVLFVVLCILCAALYYLQVSQAPPRARAPRCSVVARPQTAQSAGPCALKQPAPVVRAEQGQRQRGRHADDQRL